jgi:probable O-glycosylation ligase (exosortase A-associated)
MKQFVFMAVTTLLGTAGSLAWTPVWGVAVYYLYAVLRPQFLWEWADFMGMKLEEFQWSFAVASTTLAATALWKSGLYAPAKMAAPPWYGEPRYSRSHYLFLGFTAWICLTYVTAHSQERAYPFFLEYVKIFAMFLCSTLVLRTVRDLWLIFYVVLVAAVYIGYEINFLYLSSGWLILQSRGYGGLDNNGAALILAMAIPMCFFGWEAVRRWWRWGFLLVIPVLIHAILLSYSRGAMLSVLAAAPLIWLRTRHKLFLTAVYVGLGGCVFVMAGKEVQERFLSISKSDADESAQSRFTTWKIAIQMASERPLVGFGIRNSNLFTYAYGADMEGRSIHSQYLQTAADSGFVALALYLGLLLSVFVGLWKVRRHLRRFDDPYTLGVRSLASGLECALFLFCFGAVFLSLEHFEMPYILILLAVQLHAITTAVAARLGAPGPVLHPGRA